MNIIEKIINSKIKKSPKEINLDLEILSDADIGTLIKEKSVIVDDNAGNLFVIRIPNDKDTSSLEEDDLVVERLPVAAEKINPGYEPNL